MKKYKEEITMLKILKFRFNWVVKQPDGQVVFFVGKPLKVSGKWISTNRKKKDFDDFETIKGKAEANINFDWLDADAKAPTQIKEAINSLKKIEE